MNISDKLVWRVYSGVLGAVTTIVAQKVVLQAWRLATGEEPPNPNDPEVPFTEAVTWALATGIGVGVAQLAMNRYVTKRWSSGRSSDIPSALRNRLSD